MRLTQHLTDLHAWCKQCLAWSRRTPDVFRPGIVGMRESLVIRLRACMMSSTLRLMPDIDSNKTYFVVVRYRIIYDQRERTRPSRPPPQVATHTRKKKKKHSKLSSIVIPSHKRCLARCSPSFPRLALHLATFRACLCKVKSSWAVKTRRAPSRHCRGTRGSTAVRPRPCSTRENSAPTRYSRSTRHTACTTIKASTQRSARENRPLHGP